MNNLAFEKMQNFAEANQHMRIQLKWRVDCIWQQAFGSADGVGVAE
jgi:hypothetical protein